MAFLQVYANAAACHKAVADHLQAVKGKYLLGNKPSSADAYLYGHLCIQLRAPIAAPELQHSVRFLKLSFCYFATGKYQLLRLRFSKESASKFSFLDNLNCNVWIIPFNNLGTTSSNGQQVTCKADGSASDQHRENTLRIPVSKIQTDFSFW